MKGIEPGDGAPRRARRGAVRWRSLLAVSALFALAGCADLLLSEEYQYGRLQVEAVDTAGAPVPGVELILYQGATIHAYGVTGSDGRHEFRFVTWGTFGVSADPPPGFAFPPGTPPFILVSFESDETKEESIRFVLEPEAEAAALRRSAARSLDSGGSLPGGR